MAIDSIRQLTDYMTDLVPARPEELRAMEAYAEQHRFPIVGPAAGNLCYQLARTVGAQQVFELGSGYGYSTAWFARAVQENGGGTVHHVVWDEALSARARRHLAELGFSELISYQVGEAVEALRRTEGPFHLIFNDIDKEGYPASWPVIAGKVRPGGVVITDNMFMGGRVFDENETGGATRGVREFTRLVTTDPNWISTIVPIRDGLMVSYRR